MGDKVQPISVCMVNGKSTVFYVGNDKCIHYYTAKQNLDVEQESPRLAYNDDILFMPKSDNVPIISTTKDLGALSYPLSGSGIIRSRVYFASEKGILNGVEKEGDAPWEWSAISALEAKVQPGTSIAALISPQADQAKVFFFKEGDNSRPWVAWWVGPEKSWQMGPIS